MKGLNKILLESAKSISFKEDEDLIKLEENDYYSIVSIKEFAHILSQENECKDKNSIALVFPVYNENQEIKDVFHLKFYITPLVFYFQNTNFKIENGKFIYDPDIDYSEKWIDFLIKKYNKNYTNKVFKDLKNNYIKK